MEANDNTPSSNDDGNDGSRPEFWEAWAKQLSMSEVRAELAYAFRNWYFNRDAVRAALRTELRRRLKPVSGGVVP